MQDEMALLILLHCWWTLRRIILSFGVSTSDVSANFASRHSSVERCFLAVNTIKNVLGNKMGEQFTIDCLIFYVEKDIYSTIRYDVVIYLLRRKNIVDGSYKM